MAKANKIQAEIKETRQHIEDTGSAMVEKLELLEERLRASVEGVKRNFDLHYQVEQHPLALFGGSLLIGYLLGNFFAGRRPAGDQHPQRSSDDRGALDKALRRNESSHRAVPYHGNGVRDHFKNEIATTVKGMAAGALTSTLWEMAKQVLFKGGAHDDDASTAGREADSHRQRRWLASSEKREEKI